MAKVTISLGSNLGDRVKFLQKARDLISVYLGAINLSSQLYETAAWGNEQQNQFINQVILVSTKKSPMQTLDTLLFIEHKLGRQRIEKWCDRTIDLDILTYDNVNYHSAYLIIPHPYLDQRKFVLTPLQEIQPNFIHPINKIPIKVLLQECSDTLSVAVLK